MHRVMSTQKLPMVGELRREKPRTRRWQQRCRPPALTNCWTVSTPICEKYDIVVSPP